jgi:hypothetical protein
VKSELHLVLARKVLNQTFENSLQKCRLVLKLAGETLKQGALDSQEAL